MSFKQFLEDTNNASEYSKEHKLVLLIGKELEESGFELKNDNKDDFFNNFKNQEGKFSFDFLKNNIEYNLIIKNKKDGKYEISLATDKKSTSEELKIDNYFKDNDYSLLKNYIKDRIKNIEVDPLLYNVPKNTFHNMNKLNINRMEMNDNFNRNNLFQEPDFDVERNFANIGYNDLHGDLPNFSQGYNNYYGVPRGNLVGPEAFNRMGPGGIRYDPITPFGPKFDFIPPYDGPMKRNGDIDIGIPKWPSGNSFDKFGGGYNPFI